jgi:hypothetical protein
MEARALRNIVNAGYAEGVSSLDQKVVAKALLAASQKTYPRITKARPPSFLEWQDYINRILRIYSVLGLKA